MTTRRNKPKAKSYIVQKANRMLAELPKPTRQVILEEGAALTTADRNKTYGDATVNMQHMAGMLTAYFSNLIRQFDGGSNAHKYHFTGEDAAQIMAIAKMSRTAHRGVAFHKDNYTDQAVYSAMAGECAEKERGA